MSRNEKIRDSVVSISELIKEQQAQQDYGTVRAEVLSDPEIQRESKHKYFLATSHSNGIAYLSLNGRVIEFNRASNDLQQDAINAISIELKREKKGCKIVRSNVSAFYKAGDSAQKNSRSITPVIRLRPRASSRIFSPVENDGQAIRDKDQSPAADSGISLSPAM